MPHNKKKPKKKTVSVKGKKFPLKPSTFDKFAEKSQGAVVLVALERARKAENNRLGRRGAPKTKPLK